MGGLPRPVTWELRETLGDADRLLRSCFPNRRGPSHPGSRCCSMERQQGKECTVPSQRRPRRRSTPHSSRLVSWVLLFPSKRPRGDQTRGDRSIFAPRAGSRYRDPGPPPAEEAPTTASPGHDFPLHDLYMRCLAPPRRPPTMRTGTQGTPAIDAHRQRVVACTGAHTSRPIGPRGPIRARRPRRGAGAEPPSLASTAASTSSRIRPSVGSCG
jgi:hypothetical protein